MDRLRGRRVTEAEFRAALEPAGFEGIEINPTHQGAHPDWGTLVFNYGRHEVRNFLISNALFWLREYHVDGIRVDAVASMLYLDYSRRSGEWVSNEFGGREDLDAIAFLKELNEVLYGREPEIVSAAEESTAWPGVSRPTCSTPTQRCMEGATSAISASSSPSRCHGTVSRCPPL